MIKAVEGTVFINPRLRLKSRRYEVRRTVVTIGHKNDSKVDY